MKELKKYYGKIIGSLNICLTPDNMYGYGVSLEFEDRIEMIPTMWILENRFNYLAFLIHELSHPYINSQIHQLKDIIEKSSSLFAPIKSQMRRQAYPNWEITLIEHIVRANTINLMGTIFGKDKEAKMIKAEKSKGFIYRGFCKITVLQNTHDYVQNLITYSLNN